MSHGLKRADHKKSISDLVSVLHKLFNFLYVRTVMQFVIPYVGNDMLDDRSCQICDDIK